MSIVEPGPLIDTVEGYDAEAIMAASTAVRSYCGWHIAPPITTDIVVDGPGSTTLLLPTVRLLAVNSITVNGDDVDLAGVEWSRSGVLRGPFRTTRFSSITVNVTHGYAECPRDIRAVILGMARAGLGASRVTTQMAGTFMQVFAKEAAGGAIALGTYDTAILDRYRLPDRS